MKKLILLTIVVCLYSWPVYGAYPTTGTTASGNYCFVPPYLTQNVKPNINLIFDMSGSMQEPANISTCTRSGDTTNPAVSACSAASLPTADQYNANKDYYGYFDSAKYYAYDSAADNRYFINNTSACTSYTNRKGSATGCLSGNLLNWILTTRIDSVRKIFTGGRIRTTGTPPTGTKVVEVDGSKYTFTDPSLGCVFTVANASTGTDTAYVTNRTIAITSQSGYTCALGTLTAAKTDVVVPSEDVAGVIQGLYTVADLEVAVFGNNSTRYKVGKLQTLQTYLDAVNNEAPYGATPTGTSMAAAKNFWLQNSSAQTLVKATTGASTTYLKDPFYDSDGGATATSLAVPCRKSFNLLVSDGQWPDLSAPAFAATMPSGVNSSDPLTDVHTMHTTDMRTALNGGDTTNKRTVTTYTVYAYGDGDPGRNSMIAMAIFGGYEDKYGAHSATATTTAADGYPYPFTRIPYDSRSTRTQADTVPYALSKCIPTGTWDQECAEWDKDKTGLPYNFFEGSDGAKLQASITKAVRDMLTRASSGTAASMLGNTDSSGAVMLQALFFPERQFTDSTAHWLGDVQAFWYYLDPGLSSTKLTLREDSVQDYKLKKSEDRIARFIFNGTATTVKLYADANSDGIEDSATAAVEENIDEVKALWRAGLNLWSRMPSGTGGRTVYTNNLASTATSSNLMSFSTGNLSLLKTYLDVPGTTSIDTDATNVINYTLGLDPPHNDLSSAEKSANLAGFRSRTVKIGSTGTHVWKLGDIINSTPKMISSNPLNSYNAASPGGYRDSSYDKFISTLSYKNRGVAFVGGNDGMLHAFKMGKNIPGSSGYVSQLVNSTDLIGRNPVAPTEMGKELWSYIPNNVLPYLKHRGNPAYTKNNHMFFVDSTPTIIDASIAVVDKKCSNDPLKGCSVNTDCALTVATCNAISPTCTGSDCPKIDKSWRTVLIGSMGLGGATRNNGVSCTNCVNTPIVDIGYSSYFALDVTEAPPTAPALLWEFANPLLGYSTVGPAVVRIKDASDTGSPALNGKFYAVLASGPTGPIDTSLKQMKAFSDQPLRIFVLDLRTGTVVRTFSNEAGTALTGMPADTHTQFAAMPSLAFGGTFSNSTIDTDKGFTSRAGNYSDDAIYLGYVRQGVAGDTPAASIGKFAKGGVLRIFTGDNPSPASWKISTVIDGIGPVTSAVAKIQDTYNKNLWLFFGSGRYFYKNGSTVDEDYSGLQESMYGIKDPCYIADTASSNLNDFDATCTATVLATSLKDQTSSTSALVNEKGWKINLDGAAGTFKAKRVYTNPTATSNGVIFFTTFKPSAEPCSYGGDTSLWAVNYSDAGSVSGKNLKGQALMQLATGELKQVDLSSAFSLNSDRETVSFKGPPSREETQITSNANHSPSRKILHIMER